MTQEITFDETALPEHPLWDYLHTEPGTAIWARHVSLDEFTANHDLGEAERAAYQSTGTDPSYQIELQKVADGEYGVTIARSTGPDSADALTPDCRKNLDATAALTHVQYLLKTYA